MFFNHFLKLDYFLYYICFPLLLLCSYRLFFLRLAYSCLCLADSCLRLADRCLYLADSCLIFHMFLIMSCILDFASSVIFCLQCCNFCHHFFHLYCCLLHFLVVVSSITWVAFTILSSAILKSFLAFRNSAFSVVICSVAFRITFKSFISVLLFYLLTSVYCSISILFLIFATSGISSFISQFKKNPSER